MYLKLKILDYNDYDLEIVSFKNIGFLENILYKIIYRKQYKSTFVTENEIGYKIDILMLLLMIGYIHIPSKNILKYKNIPIKIIYNHTKEVKGGCFKTYIIKI